jgi:hypothetical protein
MKGPAVLILAASVLSLLSGCVTSISPQAKLLAATQECGGAGRITLNPGSLTGYSHCVDLQLEAIEAEEAAFERRQADVLVGLAKALEPAPR